MGVDLKKVLLYFNIELFFAATTMIKFYWINQLLVRMVHILLHVNSTIIFCLIKIIISSRQYIYKI